MLKQAAIGVGAGLGMLSGVYFGSAIAQTSKYKSDSCGSCSSSDRFNHLANVYDKEIGPTETSFGMMEMRKKMIGTKAHGVVLETCCGTGRNLDFYNYSKLDRLVLTDASEEMLDETRIKLNTPQQLLLAETICTKTLDQFPADSFDIVVDTFGICSVAQPEEFLLQVKRVLKPGGKALFLEHGRNEHGWFRVVINAWLDFRAPAHEAYWGCLWNREISKLITDAGFKVEYKQVKHYGTCTEIHATK